MKKIFQTLILASLCTSTIFTMDNPTTSSTDNKIDNLSLDQVREFLKKDIITNDSDKDLSIQQLFESKHESVDSILEINKMLAQFNTNPGQHFKDVNFINTIIKSISSIKNILLKLKGKPEHVLLYGSSISVKLQTGLPYHQTTKWYNEYNQLIEVSLMFGWFGENINSSDAYEAAIKKYEQFQTKLI
jgi:hypothetical protein